MKVKKKVAFLLAGFMLLSLAACGNSPETEGPSSSEQNSASVAETDAEEVVFPDIEKQNYNGESFRMIGIREAGIWAYGEGYNSGKNQVLNDTLYEMNTMVEDYLGISIEYDYVQHITGESVVFDRVKPLVMAGDDTYQLCILPAYRNIASFVMQDCVMDFYELEGLNFDRPYWKQDVIESLKIGEHAYIATGDLCYYQVYPIYCNKDLLATVGREIPYDKVRNGTWTLDEFLALSTDLYADNGNGAVDNRDTFGYTAVCDMNINSFMQASNIYVVTRHDDGSFEFSLYNDRMINLYDKIYAWSKNESVYMWGWGDEINQTENVVVDFLDNRTYFTQEVLDTQFLSADFDFGILPLPKYEAAQEKYAHVNWGDNLVVPCTVKNTAMVSQALELMSYYSRVMVMPKYYDGVLELRVSDAPDDREMVELIFDTVVFDPGIAYCDGNTQLFNLVYLPNTCILSDQKSIASYYASNERGALHYLTKRIYG